MNYLNQDNKSHRKKYGQYFTPKKIAKLMIDWITQHNKKNVLDPAFGLGVFKEVAPTLRFQALEIDKEILKETDYSFVENKDYLQTEFKQLEAIIANPPYLKFQNNKNIIQKLEKKLDIKISGYINMASLFLLKSISELANDGVMAYIMPYEFLNTSYGESIKLLLKRDSLLKHLIVFENESEIFPEVTTTICVLLIRKDFINSKVKLSIIKSMNELNIESFAQLKFKEIDIEPKEKFQKILLKKQSSNLIALSHYGKFKRGIATGANNFFSLNQELIDENNIPLDNIIHCISKSQDVKNIIFNKKDLENLKIHNKKVFLLNIKNIDNQTQCYLDKGVKDNLHQRYITQNRTPWHKMEKRKISPLWAGVFNRGEIKFVRNYTDAISLTCFHNFYSDSKYIDHLFLYFLSDIGKENLKREQRQYGNKLGKFEPNDLNKVLVPKEEFLESLEIASIMQNLKKGIEQSQEINNLFNSLYKK